MSYVNRNAMMVSPGEPLYIWLRKSLKNYSPGDEAGTIFLIPELENSSEFEFWLSENYDIFFEEILSQYVMNESLWPKKRTYKMFREWFIISYNSIIMDFVNAPLLRE
jgi:hypothetical protein